MRKRRVVIYDDEVAILDVMRVFFERRGYEVITFPEPQVCPVYAGRANCTKFFPCADVMITDYRMPVMTGLELLTRQRERGCVLDIRNKAIMSGFADSIVSYKIEGLGCSFFPKPIRFTDLFTWIDACEQRIDLSVPLSGRRRQDRFPVEREIGLSIGGVSTALKGIMLNISESGCCVKSRAPLSSGQIIRLSGEAPVSCRDAEVKWTGTADGYCIAGLHCL